MSKKPETAVNRVSGKTGILTEVYVVPQIFTIPDAAEILKTSPSAVRALVKSGRLRAMKLGEIKISSFELVRFMNENKGKNLSDPLVIKAIVTGGKEN